MKKYEYYKEVDMGPALICDPPCNYQSPEDCPSLNPSLKFDEPEISDEEIRKYHFLLGFLNWIHFDKGVYLARFKKKEGFTFDGMPWSSHLEEYLGFNKFFENKPRNERCFIGSFLRKKLRCSEFTTKGEEDDMVL